MNEATVWESLTTTLRRRKVVTFVILTVVIMVGLTAVQGFVTSARAAPLSQKPTPHTVEGRQDCLQCHNTGGIKPIPANHAGRAVATCLACHPQSQQPPASAPSGSIISPSDITPTPSAGSSCLACHTNTSQKLPLPSGGQLSLNVDLKALAASVHGNKLSCTDCHKNITTYPHPKRQFSSQREYTLAQYELCKTCHFANYTKTLESMHYTVLAGGDERAPVCVDCHGAHDVAKPGQPKTTIAQSCASCHQEIHKTYASSVHGKALIDESNKDVPVCTDCHGAHGIQDPRTAAARLESPELCAKCHSDTNLMDKYGLSTNVVKTYLQDFHGVTVSLYKKQSPDIWSYKAVCTDCHGVHNVAKTDDPEAGLAIKSNAVAVCQKCHPNATENFPAAWLSHYEPSLQKASLVFLVRSFYWVLIPFIIGGLVLHILLDLWRMATNR